MGLPKSLGYGILAEREISYTYDSLYRLTAADYSTPSAGSGQAGEAYAYRYDPVGNREIMTDAIGIHTYAYDPANRLTSIQLPDSSIQGYTWDHRGNLVSNGAFTYTYSAAGRMVRDVQSPPHNITKDVVLYTVAIDIGMGTDIALNRLGVAVMTKSSAGSGSRYPSIGLNAGGGTAPDSMSTRAKTPPPSRSSAPSH
jgi:YD repeat-containing protein